MKTKHLTWLLIAAFLVWFVPWQGKLFAPALFGSSSIQWTSAGLLALLLPLGMILSGHALATRPAERKKTGGICVCFLLIFCHLLGVSSLTGSLMAHFNNTMEQFDSPSLMPLLMHKLEQAPTEEKRQNFARGIYMLCGVAVPYRKDNGVFTVYQPTEKDKISWLENQERDTQILETRKQLDWKMRELAYITAAYIVSFFLICLGGILILICKKQPGGLDSPAE